MLFGHFVTTFNAAFEWKLALEDEGYESGSENFNISTPTEKNIRRSIMCLVLRTLHLIQIQLHQVALDSLTSDHGMQMATI